MAINQGDLKAITNAPSAVDSFIATLDALVGDQTITGDVRSLVTIALNRHRDELEKAIVANTKN